MKNLARTTSLSFTHNRDSVDVHQFDAEGNKIITTKNVSAALFLEFFDYGTTVYEPSDYTNDSKEVMNEFLQNI